MDAPFVRQWTVQVFQMRVSVAKFDQLTEPFIWLIAAPVEDQVGHFSPASMPSPVFVIVSNPVNEQSLVVNIFRCKQKSVDPYPTGLCEKPSQIRFFFDLPAIVQIQRHNAQL